MVWTGGCYQLDVSLPTGSGAWGHRNTPEEAQSFVFSGNFKESENNVNLWVDFKNTKSYPTKGFIKLSSNYSWYIEKALHF